MQRTVVVFAALVALASSCFIISNTNVTSGVAIMKKFVVSDADCCSVCASQGSCVTATYAQYYCTLYSSMAQSGPAPGVSLIVVATPAPTPPPTPAPPLPPPTAYAVLFSAAYSSTCNFTQVFKTEVLALPMARCEDVPASKRSSKAKAVAGGIWLERYAQTSCKGTAQGTWYPRTCTYNEGDYEYRQGYFVPWVNTTDRYQLTFSECGECHYECSAQWTGVSGECNQGSTGSSSSSSGLSTSSSGSSASGAAPPEAASWMALYLGDWAIVREYLTSDCSGPSSGLAYPCGTCFANQIAATQMMTCAKI
jgi:hypothetical protein